MFRLAVQTGGVTKGITAKELTEGYAMIRRAGFEAVDANFDHLFPSALVQKKQITEPFRPGTTDKETAEYFKPWGIAAKETGIDNYQGHASFPSLLYREVDDEYDAFMLDVLRKTVIGAAEADCHNLVIHAFYRAYEMMRPLEKDYEDSFNRYLSLAKTAKENGVTICVENLCLHDGTIHYGGFLNNPFIAAKMVDELNAAAGAKVFGFCLDVGHSILAANDPKNFMLTLGDRIQCFHVHDNDKLTDQHLAPYMGKLDWDRFADGLREIHFNKTMSFETFHYARIMDSLGILEDGLKMLYKVGEAIQRKAAWEE